MSKSQTASKTVQAAPKSYTPYQGQYFAHALTLDGQTEDTLSRSIASAKVDMNPHQVEAALFALRSPLSQGVILADEVGLGKTIEASLVIAQKWAERQRKILLIVPAMLRNQWAQELSEKFSLPTTIMETASYNVAKKTRKLNPFESDKIVICSYEFAAGKDVDVKNIDWNLVIFDEAHKVRNVWQKEANKAKKAKKLQAALDGKKKMLLSATPLQNSLLELYGLVSIIDPHFFGSADAFKSQYVGGRATTQNLDILKHRLSKVCNRTLRRQVQQEGGIKFTKRHSIVEDFRPSQEELDLYESISSYLQRDDIASIKPGARHLVTLVIRKILASSSFAISGTLEKMIERLESGLPNIDTDTLDDIENVKEIAEELDIDEDEDGERADANALKKEIEELKSYQVLAKRIQQNEKGNALLKVLDRAFTRVTDLGGKRKAVIFTESCRTQAHLKELLEANGYKGEIVLLNGSNNDPEPEPENKGNGTPSLFDAVKEGYPLQKFDSVDGELRFAGLLEDDATVVKWMKPAPGVFRIEYRDGIPYNPDFVVETKTEKLICEPKMESEMKDDDVLAKARSAVKWCHYASEYAKANGKKPWSYLLIPHTAIGSNRTLDSLKADYLFNELDV